MAAPVAAVQTGAVAGAPRERYSLPVVAADTAANVDAHCSWLGRSMAAASALSSQQITQLRQLNDQREANATAQRTQAREHFAVRDEALRSNLTSVWNGLTDLGTVRAQHVAVHGSPVELRLPHEPPAAAPPSHTVPHTDTRYSHPVPTAFGMSLP
eukprot:TRINITY_DN14518_c0_g1_i1.p2 TRINITY_DN14518_c0_g1~~TRINITY_DN14518_c0_g1_i1.p2  ORF type:complete len:175 (+),score=45.07 TRINITY_DN14518_c0_g1_i1:59-526(+)